MLICPRCAAFYPEGAASCPHCGRPTSAAPGPEERGAIDPVAIHEATEPYWNEPSDDTPELPQPARTVTHGDESTMTRTARRVGLWLGFSGGVCVGGCLLANAFVDRSPYPPGVGIENGCFALLVGPVLGGIGGAVFGWSFAFVLQAFGRTTRNLLDPRVRAAMRHANEAPQAAPASRRPDESLEERITTPAGAPDDRLAQWPRRLQVEADEARDASARPPDDDLTP